jgi:Iodothyronine deiodinase
MTAAAAPGTERVRNDFKDRDVEFFLVYVREAHPGERYPAHETSEQKIQDAKALAELEGIGAKVLVDDLDGTIHRNYGQQPNMLYVIDKEGRVFFRALWAAETSLRRALTSLLRTEEAGEQATPRENLSTLVPMLYGMSEVPRVLARAGNQSVEDFRQAMGRSALLVARGTSWLRPIFRAAPSIQIVLVGGLLAVPALVFLLKAGRKERRS